MSTVRTIDEDTITQAVIARHVGAPDARLRDLMTSLVQHLHAFAREVRLAEDEWAAGLRFLEQAGRHGGPGGAELARLSDALGLSALVQALAQRRTPGCTEGVAFSRAGTGDGDAAAAAAALEALPCVVHGQVRTADGRPLPGARLQAWPGGQATSGDDGRYALRARLLGPSRLADDGPVADLLARLGREAWRPAHLRLRVVAPGCRPLSTELFRRDSPHLDADALFGARRTLLADCVRHPPGPTPDGSLSSVPFDTLAFDLVLQPAGGSPCAT